MKILRILLPSVLCCSPVLSQAQEPADSSRIFEIAEVDTRPLPLNADELYSLLRTVRADRGTANRGVTIEMSFVIGADGIPRGVTHGRSTDHAFNSIAFDAVSLLRFSPAMVSGRPVPVRIDLPLNWYPPSSPPRPEEETDACTPASIQQNAGTAPIYSLDAVSVLGELPRPMNRRELVREFRRLYPGIRAQGGMDAQVHTEMVVNEHGQVVALRVLRSTDARFNTATQAALRILRFTPARMMGIAVGVCVEQPVQWSYDP